MVAIAIADHQGAEPTDSAAFGYGGLTRLPASASLE